VYGHEKTAKERAVASDVGYRHAFIVGLDYAADADCRCGGGLGCGWGSDDD
jgi:hypothetical protein